MLDWNQTFTSPADVQDIAVLNLFIAAVRERQLARAAASQFPPALMSFLEPGDFCQNTLGRIQYWIYHSRGGFIDINKTFDGRVPPPAAGSTEVNDRAHWTYREAGNYAPYGDLPDTLYTAAGLHPNGWTRKKPREILDPNVFGFNRTEDLDGNPAVAGQRAYGRYAFDSHAGPYEFDGTQWVLDRLGPSADVLSSDQPSPDHCPHGMVQDGDYLGPWLLNEIRDVLNVMVWTTASWHWVFDDSAARAFATGSARSDVNNGTLLDARDQAEDNLINNPTHGGIDSPRRISFMRHNWNAAPWEIERHIWNASLEQAHYRATCSLGAPMNRSVEFYCWSWLPEFSIWDYNDVETHIFDDLGTGLVENGFRMIHAAGPAADTEFNFTFGPPVPADPAWGPDPAAPEPSTDTHPSSRTSAAVRRGWRVPAYTTSNGSGLAVVKWDVPGGFQYTSSI